MTESTFIEQIFEKITAQYMNYFYQYKDKLRIVWLKIVSEKWNPSILNDETIKIPMEPEFLLLSTLDDEKSPKGNKVYWAIDKEEDNFLLYVLKDSKKNILEKKIIQADIESSLFFRVISLVNEKNLGAMVFEDKNSLLAILLKRKHIERKSHSIPVFYFLQHLLYLHDLLPHEGIQKLLENFKNPEQFSSGFFEIRCAHFTFSQNTISNVVFSPKVLKKDGCKYPEFKFDYMGYEIYCECKSLINFNRTYNKLQLTTKLFEDFLDDLEIPNDLRAEIFIGPALPNVTKNLCEKLKSHIELLIKKKTFDPCPLRISNEKTKIICCIKKNNMSVSYVTSINVGIRPREINQSRDNKDFSIIFSYGYKIKEIRESVRNNIQEAAVLQLPKDKLGIIFIEVFEVPNSIKIAKDKIKSHENIICIVLEVHENNDYPRRYITKSKYKSFISSLFNTSEIIV